MASREDQEGAPTPPGKGAQGPGDPQAGNGHAPENPVSYASVTGASSAYAGPHETSAASTALVPAGGGSGGSTPPPPPSDSDEGNEEEGMLRMSFLEHLEELRSRILRALAGVGVAFVLSLTFCNELWKIVSQPAVAALKTLGLEKPQLTQIAPMDYFNIVWVKLPILTAIFIASPWILYQVWGFIAPGLYRRERRWAAPFVICSAGLFVIGGLFGYFVAFRYGLTFLLGLGIHNYVTPMVSMTEYFDLFVDVILGIGLIFEMPVLIFFLTLLHIASPRFLIRHSRYAILAITIIAAVVTPTPDVFNMMLFAVPMCLLFYLGIFASYLLVLHRERRKFPWRPVLWWTGSILIVATVAGYFLALKYGYHPVLRWPFLVR
ncbi:MAG TPA: twin-arginine translocase subunit TatC [Bryobacteraceae bacterium]|nr:twin-arginine translocase subunit TatC [Bryobacteraceae bacterium]